MPKVLLSEYSTYSDHITGVQFNPVLNRRTGLFVAIADVDAETAQSFVDRSASFSILTDDDYLSITMPDRTPDPVAPVTGDPLTDAGGSEPPAPPTPVGTAKKKDAAPADPNAGGSELPAPPTTNDDDKKEAE